MESKSTARELKRLEERLTLAQEARKTSEQKACTLLSELNTLRPQHQRATTDLNNLRQQLGKLKQEHEVVQTEVDR